MAIAYGTAKLYDTNRDEMQAELRAMADYIKTEGFGGFKTLMDFALDEDEEIVMALNLTTNEPIHGKPLQVASFDPFRNLYQNGPLGA